MKPILSGRLRLGSGGHAGQHQRQQQVDGLHCSSTESGGVAILPAIQPRGSAASRVVAIRRAMLPLKALDGSMPRSTPRRDDQRLGAAGDSLAPGQLD